jgi:WD40 repeat protein/mono/diheme cytochrome c family protein
MPGRTGRTASFLAALFLSAALARAAENPPREDGKPAGEPLQFTRDVAPVLVQKCQGCHGPRQQKGDYRLDTFDRLMKPGDSEAAPIVPGDPAASELFRLITSPDGHERMPQKDDPLPAEQVALIEKWIRAGGKFDGTDRNAPLQTILPSAHPAAPQTYPFPVPAVALAFRPDGREIAVGGYHEVTLWDPADGKLVRRIGNVPQQTHGLAWSPDGSLLAAAGGTPGALGEVRLLRADGSSPAPPLDRIGDVMLCAGFSPDGRLLAAGGADGAVRIYDVASGERKRLIEQHADWVTAVAFSPDGKLVASASRDKSARVFDAATGELQSAYLGHEEPPFALCWDADGKRIFTGGRDRQVHVWEPATEPKQIRVLRGFGGDVLRLTLAGEHIVSCCTDGKIRQHTRDKGELARTIEAGPDWLFGLSVHEKNGRIAAGGFDGTIRIYESGTGKPGNQFVAAPGR